MVDLQGFTLVLGSGSECRKAVMDGVLKDYKYQQIVVPIDEKGIRDADPVALTLKLAIAKAEALCPTLDGDCIVITADQVVTCNGVILEKPTSAEEAAEFLRGMTGSRLVTISSVVVTNTKTKQQFSGTDTTLVFVDTIPEPIIDILSNDESVLTCSGALKVEHEAMDPYVRALGGQGEASLESTMGLPTELTTRLIAKALAS